MEQLNDPEARADVQGPPTGTDAEEPERAELLLCGDEWDGRFNEMTSQAPPIPYANEGLSLYPD